MAVTRKVAANVFRFMLLWFGEEVTIIFIIYFHTFLIALQEYDILFFRR
jgi:hypothetical protein